MTPGTSFRSHLQYYRTVKGGETLKKAFANVYFCQVRQVKEQLCLRYIPRQLNCVVHKLRRFGFKRVSTETVLPAFIYIF